MSSYPLLLTPVSWCPVPSHPGDIGSVIAHQYSAHHSSLTTVLLTMFLPVLVALLVMGNTTASNQTNFVSQLVETARTVDIGSIDFDAILERLISPRGLVTQFALELEVQTIFTIGWIIMGN